MAVDFTTLLVKNCIGKKLLKDPRFDFNENINFDTGVQIDNKRVAEYHFCKIIVYDTGTVFFKGSLHKLYNSLNNILAPNFDNSKTYNGFNGNEFTMKMIEETIKHLEIIFNLDRSNFEFKKLEIGTNVKTSFELPRILKSLLTLNGKRFEFRYNENFAQIEMDNYFVKIYNKTNQYEMKENVLRIEIKTKRMVVFKECNLITLEDLNPDNITKALNLVLCRWEKVLMTDYTIDEASLARTQKTALNNKFKHPTFWIGLKPNKRDTPKKQFQDIILNHSDQIQRSISKSFLGNISHFN